MKSLALLLALLLAASAIPARAQILAQIEPTEAALLAQPDGSARGRWTVRNLGRDPARVRVRLADLKIGSDGVTQMSVAGSTRATLQGHVRIAPSEFTLPAGESIEIRLSGSLPDTGAATRYGMLIAEMIPADVQRWPQTPVPMGPGATLYLARAGAPAGTGEIAGLSVRQVTSAAFQVAVRVWNGGERPLSAAGDVVVRDSMGVEKARGRLTSGVVLPHAPRLLTWTCTRPLDPGRYDVIATLRSGGTGNTATTEIQWPMGRPLVFQPAARR